MTGPTSALTSSAGELAPLYLFVMILGFSRTLYAEVVTRTDIDVFLELHVHAFQAFGGMPEEILLRQPEGGGPWPLI